MIASGKQLEAVRYFREVLGVDANQALALAEKLEQEMGGPPPLLAQRVTAHLRSGSIVGRLVGRIFMTVGIIQAVVAAYLVFSHSRFERHAMAIKGTVVDYQSYVSTGSDGSTTMYTPVFEYRLNGKAYTHVDNSSSSFREFEVGEVVDILVDPENPEDVLVDSFMEKWFVPTLLGFMGIVFAGIGYGLYRILGRTK